MPDQGQKVPANKVLFARTVPANNSILYLNDDRKYFRIKTSINCYFQYMLMIKKLSFEIIYLSKALMVVKFLKRVQKIKTNILKRKVVGYSIFAKN